MCRNWAALSPLWTACCHLGVAAGWQVSEMLYKWRGAHGGWRSLCAGRAFRPAAPACGCDDGRYATPAFCFGVVRSPLIPDVPFLWLLSASHVLGYRWGRVLAVGKPLLLKPVGQKRAADGATVAKKRSLVERMRDGAPKFQPSALVVAKKAAEEAAFQTKVAEAKKARASGEDVSIPRCVPRFTQADRVSVFS